MRFRLPLRAPYAPIPQLAEEGDIMKKCLNCEKELNNKQFKYCSNKCQADYQSKQYLENWKAGKEDGLRGQYSISRFIVNYIIKKYDNKCARCGWSEINPFTGNVPLEIEHINGDHTNNNEENLTLLCPNCHSLTPTYKGANKGGGRTGRKKYNQPIKIYCIKCNENLVSEKGNLCRKCSNEIQQTIERPSREELKDLIRRNSFVEIGKKYQVSDNAIRKWCKAINLPYQKTYIKSLSDEEWENI